MPLPTKNRRILLLSMASLSLSCNADSPIPTVQKKPLAKPDTRELLRKQLKKKGADTTLIKIKPFSELKKSVSNKRSEFSLKKITKVNEYFKIKQLAEVPCDSGSVCHYTEAGDWNIYRAWEDYYGEVYNDPRYEQIFPSNDFLYPDSENTNGDQLCAYEEQSVCKSDGSSCLIYEDKIIVHGCICPQQLDNSPPNLVTHPSECLQYDHLLPDNIENSCDSMWDRVNSCYNAGGNPLYDENQCQFQRCEGVDEGGGNGDVNQFCQPYIVNGIEKESCISCGDSQEMVFSNGTPSACSPQYVSDYKAEFFSIKSNTDTSPDAPYTQYYLNNNDCQ